MCLLRLRLLGRVAPRATSDLLFSIVLLGDSSVGKTSLLLRFVDPDGHFTEEFLKLHQNTLGVDFKDRIVDLEGRRVKLQVWDTAGQERFAQISIFVCFDVTHGFDKGGENESFRSVKTWLRRIQKHCRGAPAVVLVGTKCDLADRRTVPFATAKAFADSVGAPYLETSAVAGEGVQEAFAALARTVLRRQVEAAQAAAEAESPEAAPSHRIRLASSENPGPAPRSSSSGAPTAGPKKDCCA
eukprot:tig00000949_g5731.t1